MSKRPIIDESAIGMCPFQGILRGICWHMKIFSIIVVLNFERLKVIIYHVQTYGAFSLTWPAAKQIYWNKRMC